MKTLFLILLIGLLAGVCAGQVTYGSYCQGFNAFVDHVDLGVWDSARVAIGKTPAIIGVSNEWWRSKAFPTSECRKIDSLGATPFVHLEMISTRQKIGRDSVYSLEKILAGQFDVELKAWFAAARKYGKPLWVQWGAECNGASFWWAPCWAAGQWPDSLPVWSGTKLGDARQAGAAARFGQTYRYLMALAAKCEATNIQWVFHMERSDAPWSNMKFHAAKYLYPGSGISAMGISLYKDPSFPCPPDWAMLDSAYVQLCRLDRNIPVMLCEVGAVVSRVPPVCPVGLWWNDLFLRIETGKYPRLKYVIAWSGAYGGWRNGKPDPSFWESYNIFDSATATKVWRMRVAKWIGGRTPIKARAQ